MNDAELRALAARNQKRVDAARAALGTRYLCHPANRVVRTPPNPPILRARQERVC